MCGFITGANFTTTPYYRQWLLDRHISDTQRLYAYPPLFAVLFSPLGVFSLPHAFWVWNIASALAFWVLSYLVGSMASPRLWVRLVIWGLSLRFYATFYNFYAGQTDIFIALAVASGLYFFYYRENLLAAGLMMALAASLKVTPAIFLALWALQGRWRSVAGGTALTLMGILATWPFVSLRAYPHYFV